MEQQGRSEIEDEGVSEDLKRKAATWGKAGVFDQIAAKTDTAIDEAYEGDVK